MTDIANNITEPFLVHIGPFAVSVEHMKGSVRSGVSASGEAWERTMTTHYGSITGTVAADGDPVDAFVGPDPQSLAAFLLMQLKQDGSLDEYKVMLGFPDEESAKAGYLSNYPEGWNGFGGLTAVDFQALNDWMNEQNPHMNDALSPEGTEPVPLDEAVPMMDALLVGPTQAGQAEYMVDAVQPGGKWTRISILASLAGQWNDNGRYFAPPFMQGSLTDANAYVSAVPRYGESPHPPFSERTKTYDTNPLKEVWKMVSWFTDAASNLWAKVDIDGEAEQGKRLLTKVDRKEDIGVSVRWDNLKLLRAGKRPPTGRMNDGRTGQMFDRSMVGYVFPAVLDHVPNPAFSSAGKWMLDSQSAVAMTDATLLTDLPTAAEPCPATPVAGGDRHTPGLSDTSKGRVTMDPKLLAAKLRASAATETDEAKRQDMLDSASALELSQAQATVNLTDAQTAALDQLTSAGPDLKALVEFVRNNDAATATAAEKSKVTSLADAVAVGGAVEGFDLTRFTHESQRTLLADAVRPAATYEVAVASLRSAVAMQDSAIANARLAVEGLNLAPGGQTQTDTNQRTDVQVTRDEGDNIVSGVVDSLNAAFDRAAEENGHRTDPAVRKANQPFVDALIKARFGDDKDHLGRAKISNQALADSARYLTSTPQARESLNMRDSQQAMQDSVSGFAYSGSGMTDASVNMGTVLNQGVVSRVILQRRYQDMVSLLFQQGFTSDSFEAAPGSNSSIGTVLRVMTELWTPPSHDMLGVVFGSQIVGEDQAIPEGSLATAYQNFPVQRARLGVSVTEDIDVAMRNGPLDYNVTARALYHLIYNRQRDADNRFYTEANTTSDEIGAVVVTNETVIAANWSYNAAGSAVQDGIVYGPNVVGVAQINPVGYQTRNYDGSATVRITDNNANASTATAYRAPIVLARAITNLSGDTGAVTNTVKNPIVVTVGGTPLVQGFLEPKTGTILGANAQFAVDFARGKMVFAASSGVTGTVLPVLANYSYSTNAVYIQVKYGAAGYPNAATPEAFYNRILQATDRLVAGMAEYPNFSPPSLAISSFTGAAPITEASVFYHLNSPTGTVLGGSMEMNYASRKGVDYCQVNAPTVLGDDTILFTQKGATKLGIDLPLTLKGPFQSYDVGTGGTGNMKDSQKWFAHEFFAQITPHPRDASGNIINGKLKKLIMY